MRFQIYFELPERDNPVREYDRPTLRDGWMHAKRMALTLRLYFELETSPMFYLFVWDGQSWAPHYKIKEMPSGYFVAGWASMGRGCTWVFP